MYHTKQHSYLTEVYKIFTLSFILTMSISALILFFNNKI